MKKQENKKFGFEKFEVARLNSLKNIQGGEGVPDDGDLTDLVQAVTSRLCAKKDIGLQNNQDN